MIGVAVIGCGTISDEYLRTLTGAPSDVRVVFCADLDPGRAAAQAAKYEAEWDTFEAARRAMSALFSPKKNL